MQQIRKMGPLSNLMSMMPGVPKEMKNAEIDERELDRLEAIIRSMTAEERVNPVIIDGSRRRRIADGSGTSPNEVTQLVKQFREMQKMMKKMGGMGAMGGRKGKKAKKGKGRTTAPPALPGPPKVPLKLPGLN
jgi:signal recognition particle subunit SRP54